MKIKTKILLTLSSAMVGIIYNLLTGFDYIQ